MPPAGADPFLIIFAHRSADQRPLPAEPWGSLPRLNAYSRSMVRKTRGHHDDGSSSWILTFSSARPTRVCALAITDTQIGIRRFLRRLGDRQLPP
jgi:hypothetical protein